jgi:flagellar hook-associated protein 2
MSLSSNLNALATPMRMTGLASNLDVDSIVTKLMTAYKTKETKMVQDEKYDEWKQDAYRDIITSVKTFDDKYFDQLNKDTYILSPNVYSDYTGSSDNANVSASGQEGAVEGNYKITVNNVATKANAALGAATPGIGSALAKNLNGSDTLTVVFNGKSHNFALGNLTVDQTLKSIGSYFNLDINYSSLDSKYHITANNSKSGQILAAGYSGTNVSLGANGDFFKNLFGSGNTSTNSSATYTNDSNASITGSITGIKMADGVDANVTITEPSGATGSTTSKTNLVSVDGVQYDISKLAANADANGVVPTAGNANVANISLTQNTDNIYKKITGFIDDYNKLIQQIHDKITEKKNYTYKPLTDDQKKDMTKEDITNWEDKGKEGILANDMTLGSMLTDLRNAFYSSVQGTGLNLSDIGNMQTYGSTDSIDKAGQIQYDPEKLKTAIKKYGSDIYDLFSKKSTSEPIYINNNTKYDNPADMNRDMARRKVRYNEEGIFQRINDIMADYARPNGPEGGTLVQTAGIKGGTHDIDSTLSKDIQKKKDALDDYESYMNDKQEEYYQQYSKLESYLAQAQTQQSSLASMLK